MRATARHREAEERFREILAEADLPSPDDVGYEPESVVFYWHEPKLAVCIDFEAEPHDLFTGAADRPSRKQSGDQSRSSASAMCRWPSVS